MITKHLTASGLMIGDWVSCDGKCYQIAEIGGMVCLDAENELFASLEDIEPIPLAPEILERNGFASYNNSSFQLRENGMYISWRNVGRLNLSFGCAPTNDLHIKCKYVHQLQHALQLCGIDKEIIL